MRRAERADLTRVARAMVAGPVGAVLLVLAVSGLRAWLAHWFPALTPFSIFYPAILLAALLGGWAVGSLAVVLSTLLTWGTMLPGLPGLDPHSEELNLLIFLLVGVALAFAGARMRGLLRRRAEDNARLAERELHYRTLFEGMSDAYALMEAVRAPDGALVDFVLVEANPALVRWLAIGESIVGKNLRELRLSPRADYFAAAERALAGDTEEYLLEVPQIDRWFELRLSGMGNDRLAQIVVDVTAHKLAERRQTELFDELNHRVKNNLAMVSAILGMQARVAQNPEVREHLQNAVTRIQTIAEVHGSLHRSGRRDDVDFAAYLEHLCERLSTSVIDRARLRIDCKVEAAIVSLNDAVALGLVVNELVTNAAKHAYPTGEGVIEVTLKDTPEGLRLSVSDEGGGIAPGSGGSGLGMRLVRSLVQQCGGVLRVQTIPGARFTVELPPRTARARGEIAQSQLL